MASSRPNSEDHSSAPVIRDKWTVEEANRIVPRRLIDQEEDWSEDLKKKIEGSERLKELRKQTRLNKITALPDHESVVRQFYCSLCKEIPFPWAKNPKDEHESKPIRDISKAVFVCQNGHSMCRTCYQLVYSCQLSPSDCDYMFQKETPEGPGKLAAEEKLKLVPLFDPDSHDETQSKGNGGDNETQSAGTIGSDENDENQSPGTIGSGEDDEDNESIEKNIRSDWGTGDLRCRANTSPYVCPFSTEMIKNTEFSCRNFYNWCSFRGKGEKLSEHEAMCPNAPKEEPPAAGVEESDVSNVSMVELQLEQPDDDDDDAVLNVDFKTLLEEARLLEIKNDENN